MSIRRLAEKCPADRCKALHSDFACEIFVPWNDLTETNILKN